MIGGGELGGEILRRHKMNEVLEGMTYETLKGDIGRRRDEARGTRKDGGGGTDEIGGGRKANVGEVR